MRLRQIEVFHAIYTTGSITNAAKLLYVSQPSVSKVLSHAELQLGFQLFKRSKGKLYPTTEADMLFSEVDKIYRQIRLIRKMSENIQHSEGGIVNLALSPALGFELLPRAIEKFRRRYPNVRFKLQTLHNDNVLEALHEHKCDLALLFSSPPMPGVKEIDLGESEMVVLYSDEQFPHRPEALSVEELEDSELIDISDSGPLGELVWSRLANSDVKVKSTLQVDTYFIAAGLVSQNLGCCTVDKYSAMANLSKNVRMATFDPPMPFRIKGLCLESKPIPKICDDFTDYVKAEIQEMRELSAITQRYELAK